MDDALRRYLDEAANQPLLTRDEEVRLGREAAGGSPEARDALIRSNLRLVIALARRYTATGVPLLDLIQEGNLGLQHAIDEYDPDRGFVFSTFATWWIRQAIGAAVRGADTTGEGALGRVQDAWDAFVARNGRQPTVGELAAETGLGEDELTDLLGRPPT